MVAFDEVARELNSAVEAARPVADEEVVHGTLLAEGLHRHHLVELRDDVPDARVAEHGQAISVHEQPVALLDHAAHEHRDEEARVVVVGDPGLWQCELELVEVGDVLDEVVKLHQVALGVVGKVQGRGHRLGTRVAEDLLKVARLGAGAVSPSDGALRPEAVRDGVEDLVAVEAEDVLLLRPEGQHAGALAEHDQAVPRVGLVEQRELRADAHGQVLAGRAHVDEQAVSDVGGRVGLGVRQRDEPVLRKLQHARRRADGRLVVLGLLEEPLGDLAVLRVLGKTDVDARGLRDPLLQVLDGDLRGTLALGLVGYQGLLEQLGLSSNKRLVGVRHAGDGDLDRFLGNGVGLLPRSLALVRERGRGPALQLGKHVLALVVDKAFGRRRLVAQHGCKLLEEKKARRGRSAAATGCGSSK
mmetsp:Transcript_73110/g.194229  ORF Transcript_73110/g.194229 Transcript_73110/m.194229 type:complete len:415 (-) Transcript_73110:22-1266(-)